MGALDTLREIGRAVATCGLSTEVIELLQIKIAYLMEEIETLQGRLVECSDALAENVHLKQKVQSLENELKVSHHLPPRADSHFNPLDD